jgi:hypothetical protein
MSSEQLLGKTAIATAAPSCTTPAAADPCADATIRTEAGLRCRSAVRTAIVDGQHLHVFMAAAAIEFLAFDAQVGKVHVLVEVRQVVLERPLRNLLRVAIGVAIVVVAIAIPLVQPSLVLTLELVVEDDAIDADAPLGQALRLALVCGVDLRVVFELARAFETRIKRLGRFVVAISVRVEEVAAPVGQGDGDVTSTVEADGVDKALVTQMSEVAAARIAAATIVIAEVACWDDPKRPDGCERAGFRSAESVRAAARIVDELTIATARQIEVPHENVPRIRVPRIAATLGPPLIVAAPRVVV